MISGKFETDNPELLLALLDARPIAGTRELFDRWGAMFHTAGTHAFILGSLLQLIDERHARFNATLYQLEPDVKEAPGALARPGSDPNHRAPHRSAAAAARPRRSGAFRRRRGLPAARALDASPRGGAQSERPQPRVAGTHRRTAAVSGRRAPHPGRAADERLLPPCAHRQPLAEVGAEDGPHAGRSEPRPVARRHPVPRPRPGRPQPGVMDRRVPGGHRARHRR